MGGAKVDKDCSIAFFEGCAPTCGFKNAIRESEHPRPHVLRTPGAAIQFAAQDEIKLAERRFPRNGPMSIVAVHINRSISPAGLK